MKYYAIIVAGGSGNRMQTDIPKQFLVLQNLPVLMHTINAFAKSKFQPQILLVLSSAQHQYWENLCKQYHFYTPHQIISGGDERFHSVNNALKTISHQPGYVAIHDAVRPLCSSNLIDESYKMAKENGNAIAAVSSIDSVRLQQATNTKAINRADVFLVQTPQTFEINKLKTAYLQPYSTLFTDDASVMEANGDKIFLMEGERTNIKITYPIDLEYAELILKKGAL